MFLFALSFLTSCNSSYLIESARISEIDGGFTNLVIFANTKDLLVRRNFEDKLTAQLRAFPIKANPTYPLGLDGKDADHSLEKFRSGAAEGILVTQLLNKEEYTTVISGGSYPYYFYPVRWGRYWGFYPATYWQFDRVIKGNRYYVQTALYDIRMGEDKLIWVGKFEINDPSNMDYVIEKYVGELIAELAPYLKKSPQN